MRAHKQVEPRLGVDFAACAVSVRPSWPKTPTASK